MNRNDFDKKLEELKSYLLERREKTNEDLKILSQASRDFLNGKITEDELNEFIKPIEKRTIELNEKIRELKRY